MIKQAKGSLKDLSDYKNASLMQFYLTNNNPSRKQKVTLAASLNITCHQLTMWFDRLQTKLNKELNKSRQKGEKS